MKKLSAAVLATTIAFGGVTAFELANPTTKAEAAYVVQHVTTDKAVYTKGQTITVTGAVNPGWYDTKNMKIELNRGTTYVDEIPVTIDSNGKFTVKFKTTTSWKSASNYSVSVYHALDGSLWDVTPTFQVK